MFHDNQRVVAKDKWFIIGGNPDGNGGGVIASCNTLEEAENIRFQAIMQNYSEVRIRTWKEMMEGQ